MQHYILRKLIMYIITFFIAGSINFMLPRLMPGDPIETLVSRLATQPGQGAIISKQMKESLGLDKPVAVQFVVYWVNLFKGDFGVSISRYPTTVSKIMSSAIPYDLLIMIPAIFLSFYIGNRFGAWAAKRKYADVYGVPLFYTINAIPYIWLGILTAYFFGAVVKNPITGTYLFPISKAYSVSMVPSFTLSFILDYLHHWVLPFFSLFLVQLGGWAIGMRNMIIYELKSDYSNYMKCLGATSSLIRKYAYKNSILPQITGLAMQFGTVITGGIGTEIVFDYPGIGKQIQMAIMNQDYFLIQGCFMLIIIGVLIANFTIDILYVFIDPRIRKSLIS